MEQASAAGTPEGLLERAKCLPPYSKMCELCELCELFVKKLLSKLSALSSQTAHSLRYESSRRSKSFRFLQIISAANKQYAGARAPDRQQAAEPAALAACIPLRCFRRFTVFYDAACFPLRCFAAFATFSAAIAYSDIAAVCCDSCIVRWQEILSPFDWPPWLLRSTAALKAILYKAYWRLILRTVSYRNFS